VCLSFSSTNRNELDYSKGNDWNSDDLVTLEGSEVVYIRGKERDKGGSIKGIWQSEKKWQTSWYVVGSVRSSWKCEEKTGREAEAQTWERV
jgi:hypothetical protein